MPPVGRIVVGVDGSEGSRAALRWAVEEGRLRSAPVEAVLVWSYLDQHRARPDDPEFRPDYGEDDARQALATVVQEAVGDAAGVELVQTTVCDLPARGLLDAASGADLLVVGARGIGGFKGLLLGSVSQQVVAHAPCAVVIVRA